mgnify:CR=1 FL=1
MKTIFISYSHQESNCAKGITRFLKMQGHEVWIDDEKLAFGKEWASDIDSAINETDIMLALISKNSARRIEVLRELLVAFKRKETDKKFQIILVVLGNYHHSWFSQGNKNDIELVTNFISKTQYIQLDSRGSITLAAMRNLSNAVDGKTIYMEDLALSLNSNYIYEVGMPEKVFDSDMENIVYRVHPNDLAPSATFPFALDNQWLPDEIMADSSELKTIFMKDGFSADEIKKYLDKYQMNNLFLTLLHARQVIVNIASILNSNYFSRLYVLKNNENVSEKEAFLKLLGNGSIVVFLYGDNEISPYIKNTPNYSTNKDSIDSWNELCKQNQIYCIRENWESPIDKHSQDFAKQCTTFAFNSELNYMLADCFGFTSEEKEEFMATLKEIEMTVFLNTHILGTGYRTKLKGYSRSSFYKNFIVLDKNKDGKDSVLNCLFDTNKPFYIQLKKMIDVYYNSIFTNYFRCTAFLPSDAKPEDTFINQLYLNHGKKEVSADELKYAFSIFFEDTSIFNVLKNLEKDFLITRWDFNRIEKYRQSGKWLEYIELKEYIVDRATTWKIDFCDIKNMIQIFVSSVNTISSNKNDNKEFTWEPSYTFRVCIGSKVIDIICSEKIKKVKEYRGNFLSDKQNNLIVQFLIGDTTSKKYNIKDTIFPPIIIFDGLTNYVGGKTYYDEIYEFLIKQYDFLTIS